MVDGNTLLDIPLDEVLDTHRLTESSLTVLAKEFDMSKGGKGAKMADVESSDIFGISSWSEEQLRLGGQSIHQYNRIILKTNKQDAKNGQVSIK